MRMIDNGHAGASKVCSVMNMTPPPRPKSFKKSSHVIAKHAKTVAKKSMKAAAKEVDGSDVFTSSVVTDRTYPFQEPLIRPNRRNFYKAGYYLTFPIPYTKSLRIVLKWNGTSELNDDELWNMTTNCKKNKKGCPIVLFHSVIANKLVHGAKVKSSFEDYFSEESTKPKTKLLKRVTTTVSEMVKSPEIYGPGMRSGCKLTCQKVLSGSEVEIYNVRNTAKVIQSLLFRVYDIKQGKLVSSENWKRVLITMTWDGKDAQVKEIPLAGIFSVGLDYLREVQSLTAGFKNTTCDIQGHRATEIALRDWLAFLLYEMPFWKSAKITVGIPAGHQSAIICTQVSTKELSLDKYHPRLTGYFSAQLNQQGFDYLHHKTMFHLQKQWGHVVAINFFLRNLMIASTHELDIIIEIDETDLPVYPGSGLEDFFHYLHDFQPYRNTSSVFNGNPYYQRRGRFRIYRCFRHMLFDPILFTTGIRIYLESQMNRENVRTIRKFLPTSSSFNQTILPDSLLTVVLFYGSKGSGGITTDSITYGEWNRSLALEFQFSPQNIHSFPVYTMFENEPGVMVNRTVVSLKPGQQVTHTFKIARNNVGVILRKEYRTIVPNQKADVKVDGEDAGLWFSPQRALTEAFSLRIHDYLLPPEKTARKDSINVVLTAITRWEIISIKVVSVMLTN
ncbi:Hypothetical predicted protein [Paramuricea clavata]|uniref:Uncharacterized protein n=1 Tax=Paramuricea clavata TaxID=317549 RepID=A0A6S7IVN2_PARCT|nr:Hypothetical predicted protein [Paramuricea clavata]